MFQFTSVIPKHRLGLSKDNLNTVGQYALTVVLCVLILTWIMKLWRADFNLPFAYFGDSLLYSIGGLTLLPRGAAFRFASRLPLAFIFGAFGARRDDF